MTWNPLSLWNSICLSSIIIPSSVTSIGSLAFFHCSSLTSISIPISVTSIGDSAFYQCFCLKSISIPKNVTLIENQAFYECYNLTSIVYKGYRDPGAKSSNVFSVIDVRPKVISSYQGKTFCGLPIWKRIKTIQIGLSSIIKEFIVIYSLNLILQFS